MSVNQCLLTIMPMTVGRGDAGKVVEAILRDGKINLTKLRIWSACRTTWKALLGDSASTMPGSAKPIWVCLFEAADLDYPTHDVITALMGPEDRSQWRREHLRWQYSSFEKLGPAHPYFDYVGHVSSLERMELEKDILFND